MYWHLLPSKLVLDIRFQERPLSLCFMTHIDQFHIEDMMARCSVRGTSLHSEIPPPHNVIKIVSSCTSKPVTLDQRALKADKISDKQATNSNNNNNTSNNSGNNDNDSNSSSKSDECDQALDLVRYRRACAYVHVCVSVCARVILKFWRTCTHKFRISTNISRIFLLFSLPVYFFKTRKLDLEARDRKLGTNLYVNCLLY